jgi:pimeloyl-ACP methyl ester carboxylesterase
MKIRDVDLVVRDTGGTGISVLLIHGSLAKDFLLPLGEALTTTGKFRVISYDRRGYGCRPARAQDMEREAEDASEVLRQLGIGNAHVFGHSTGGSIALQLTHQSPDQVASLLLGEPDIPWRHAPSRAAIEEGYKQLAEMYEKEPKEDVFGAIMSELHGPNYMDVFPADMRDLAAADMSVFFEFECQAFLDWQLAPGAVKAFKMPVLFIYGENTGQTNKEVGEVLQQWNGDITTAQIRGSTHTFPWTHPREAAEAIADFALGHVR